MGCIQSKKKFQIPHTISKEYSNSFTTRNSLQRFSSRSVKSEDVKWKANVECNELQGTSRSDKVGLNRNSEQERAHRDLFSIFGAQEESKSPASCSSSVMTDLCDSIETKGIYAPPEQTYLSLNVSFGVYSTTGVRAMNEDRHCISHRKIHDSNVGIFSIFDGHGGVQVAEHLEEAYNHAIFTQLENHYSMEEAVKRTCAEVDHHIYMKGIESGATAVTMLIRDADVVFSSVGDSQVVMSQNGVAKDMCISHKPSLESEKKRIESANGSVINDRIFGVLGVSRAFGDNDFKTSKGDFTKKFKGDLVSADPCVVKHRLSPEDEFAVLACDGLFDVMSPQQVVTFVRSKLANDPDLQSVTRKLVSQALKLGSVDNVSVIIVYLQPT